MLDSGSDELTPKGFMYNQVKIADGIYVDVYNLHADADTDTDLKSEAVRRSNIIQLAIYIEQYSQGHAVIVFGEINCRYTITEDDLKSLFADRLDMKDLWIEKIKNGIYPEMGEALL